VLATIAAGAARALGVTDPSAEIIRAFGAAMPDEVADLVGGELRRVVERQTPALVSFGAVAALLVATGGTNTVFKALRRAFGVTEPRPAWRTYLLAVTLTLLAGSLTVLVAVLVLGLQAVGAEASASVGLEAMWRAALVLRWPVAVPLLTLAAGVLFRYGTVQRPGWRAIAGGSLFFAAGWLVFTYLFVLYVDVVAGYGATYGALGGVAGLLVWLYCSAFVLVVGAEITASLHGSRAGEVEAAAAGSAPAPAHD
jgi:membrane protein